jgi:hypothetical protein
MCASHFYPCPAAEPPTPTGGLAGAAFYRIRVEGYLNDSWSVWFDNLTVSHPGGSETALSGVVTDQAALYGLLSKVFNLGLVLLEVTRG